MGEGTPRDVALAPRPSAPLFTIHLYVTVLTVVPGDFLQTKIICFTVFDLSSNKIHWCAHIANILIEISVVSIRLCIFAQ